MKAAVALLLLALVATPLSAQELSREEALDLIGKTLADIKSKERYEMQKAGWTEEAVERILRIAFDLRDKLASNPYVRVSSVSIGVPGGLSLELSFPESPTAKP